MNNSKKDPLQIADMRNSVLYTFGESTIEVGFVKVDEAPEGHPFERVKKDDIDAGSGD